MNTMETTKKAMSVGELATELNAMYEKARDGRGHWTPSKAINLLQLKVISGAVKFVAKYEK